METTKSDSKHTLLPWEWYREDGSMVTLCTKDDPLEGHVLSSALCSSCHKRFKRGSDETCLMPSLADAAFIVKACNAHDVLTTKLREWDAAMEYACAEISLAFDVAGDEMPDDAAEHLRDALAAIRTVKEKE